VVRQCSRPEATVPDGDVTGTLQLNSREVTVAGWRGTVGHNWGSEHADSWVRLHAAGFGNAPEAWLELVLGLGGERIVLGGLGRRLRVAAGPSRLTASVASPQARLQLVASTASARRYHRR
jgi:hypothetical protein